LEIVFQQLFPLIATDDWLDLHCNQIGVERQQATKARHQVRFFREDTAGNVNIPKGRIVKTKPDGTGAVHRFIVMSSVVLPAGASEMVATVEAEEYGSQGNVTQGMICEITTTIPGVDGVINDADSLMVEACDKELDGPLQERYVLAWQDVNGLTKYAYESWARSVPGVISARVMDLHPRGQGTVDVVVKGTAGLPTQELLDKVEVVIEANRPINDDVKVKGPVPVPAFIEAELVLISGTPEIILPQAAARISAMFEDPSILAGIEPLQIGEDLTLDRLGYVLMAISGVKRIKWPEGSGDILVPPDGLAVLTGSKFTLSWEDA
jgi:uncharacterized phage protein gp47/JayE